MFQTIIVQVTQQDLLVTPLLEELQAKQMMDEEPVESAKEVRHTPVFLLMSSSSRWHNGTKHVLVFFSLLAYSVDFNDSARALARLQMLCNSMVLPKV